jgi:hypothetical protein
MKKLKLKIIKRERPMPKAQPVLTRRIKVISQGQAPIFDGSEAETFEVHLPIPQGSIARNMNPGYIYVFIIRQPSTGHQNFNWPANCRTAAEIEPQANAITIQSFIASDNGSVLRENIPGTWWKG